MHEIARMLSAVENGGPAASEELLQLVYDDLRRLAAHRIALEQPGQTLQATALVHEVYLRLVQGSDQVWSHRGHFFAAAAEAMRRILVERARQKKALCNGGGRRREELEGNDPATNGDGQDPDLLDLSEALERLETASPRRAKVVKLRYFAGLTIPEVAQNLGIAESTVELDWKYSKAWLKREMEKF